MASRTQGRVAPPVESKPQAPPDNAADNPMVAAAERYLPEAASSVTAAGQTFAITRAAIGTSLRITKLIARYFMRQDNVLAHIGQLADEQERARAIAEVDWLELFTEADAE